MKKPQTNGVHVLLDLGLYYGSIGRGPTQRGRRLAVAQIGGKDTIYFI